MMKAWPQPPDLDKPRPRGPRRAWGKVSYEDRYRRQRRDLLRAAAGLAGRQGFQGTRVADIVSEAGLSKSTFYEHFDSKEDCFIELYRRANAAMLRAGIRAAEEHLDEGAFPALLAVIRALTGYVARDPRLAEVLRGEMGAAGEPIAAERKRNLERVVDLLVVLAERLGTSLGQGELRLAATVLLHGATAVLPDLRRGEAFDERIEEIARIGCRGLGLELSSVRQPGFGREP